jgi:urease subunit alpha
VSTSRLSPAEWRARFGPRAGDRIRLADTDLWIRVEHDLQAPGDEPIWGYAKNLRLRMVQEPTAGPSELDTVVVGAVIVDPLLGVLKADIGIKDGRIVGIGRAGRSDVSEGIDLPIGPHTVPISGYGLIATPGGVDSHMHTIGPALIPAALSGAMTTLISASRASRSTSGSRRTLGRWPTPISTPCSRRAPSASRSTRTTVPIRS